MGLTRNLSVSFLLHFILIAAVLITQGSRDKNLSRPFFVVLNEERSDIAGERLKKILTKNVSRTEDIISPKSTEHVMQKPPVLLKEHEKEEKQAISAAQASQRENRASANISENIPFQTEGQVQRIIIEDVSGSSSGKAITASARGSGDIAQESDYINFIRNAIQKNLIYPFTAKKRNLEGTVLTEFSINSNGLPINIKVIKSSGFNVLDSAALQTITKASPFPVIKESIEIPITFVLKK